MFSKKLAKILPKQTNINKYSIKLENNKQLLYKQIHSLGPMKLEIFKTYLENNLANNFIQLFKFPVDASSLFFQRINNISFLCVDY